MELSLFHALLVLFCIASCATATDHKGPLTPRQDARWQTTSDQTDPHDFVAPWYSTVRVTHAVLMSTVFLILFPIGAVIIRAVDDPSKVWKLHAIIQMVAYWIFVAAAGMGIWMAKEIDQINHYHPTVGIIILVLLAVQPTTEIMVHLFHSRNPKVILAAHIHLWLGRGLLLAGIIQGGLGFLFAASFPNAVVNFWPRAVYGALAVATYIMYLAVGIIWPEIRNDRAKKKVRVENRVGRNDTGILGMQGGEATGTEMNTMHGGAEYGFGYPYGREMARF